MYSLRALAARLGCPFNGDYRFDRAVVDSRDVKPGTLFFALAGSRTDGHRFVASVLGEGGAAVVSRDGFTGPVLEVDSVEEALLEAGAWARDAMEFPVAAVTGSNGKTTTRRMIATALRCLYRTSETRGNLNNHLGLPLTLLNAPADTEFLVLEAGMNHSGELLRLGWAARPNHAVVTCIGRAHMEFFDSLDAVSEAKAELLRTTEKGGTALIPAGNGILAATAEECGLDTATHGPGGDFWLEGRTAMPWRVELDLRFRGEYNYRNALCAMAFAERLGIDPEESASALALLEPASGRGRMIRVQSRVIFDESYNANPDSTSECLRSVSVSDPPRIAVLGDMLEQGERTQEYHREVLLLAHELGFQTKITVGKHYRAACEETGTPGCIPVDDGDEALAILRKIAPEGAAILVKGSNSVGLKALVEKLEKEGF